MHQILKLGMDYFKFFCTGDEKLTRSGLQLLCLMPEIMKNQEFTNTLLNDFIRTRLELKYSGGNILKEEQLLLLDFILKVASHVSKKHSNYESSLEALFFNSRTKSNLTFPRGLISFRIRAVMIPRPLDSCMAIQAWFS